LGENNEYLIAARDLKLQEITNSGEQAKALAEVEEEYRKIILSALDYKQLKLDEKFQKDTIAIGENADALSKLSAAYKANSAAIAYQKDPLPEDPWIKHYANKEKIAEETEKQIAKTAYDEQKKANDKIEKIYEHMWDSIQDSFADTLYGMFEDGIADWASFFDSILKSFEKLLAQMVAAMITSEIMSWFTGEGGVSGVSSIASFFSSESGAASSGMESLLSAASTLASAYEYGSVAVAYLAEALGFTSVAAESAAAALAVQQTSTAAAAAAMESLAASTASAEAVVTTGSASTSGAAGASAVGVASGAAALLAALYVVGEYGDSFFGHSPIQGYTPEQMESLLRAEEQGFIELSEELKTNFKATILGIYDMQESAVSYMANISGDYNAEQQKMMDATKQTQAALLNLTMAEYDYLKAQQKAVEAAAYEKDASLVGFGYDYEKEAVVKISLEIAEDATIPIEQKMYQLGFVASKTGWESEATMAMIAEFSDQGIPWETINQSLIDYGLFESDVYKRIYAEYNGQGYKGLGDWEQMNAALNEQGVSTDVIKTVQAYWEGNVTYDEFLTFLNSYSGLDQETINRIVGTIDPSDEWDNLVIPVDAPESIPLEMPDMAGKASGGPVSGGTPYVVGERGPELFMPQSSGHILSNENMRRLLGAGIKGYASGTTDPLPGTQDWWEANPPSEQDISGATDSASSAFETLAEWESAYAKELEKMLGIDNEVGDELKRINEYYAEQNEIALKLNASSEQLLQLEEDKLAAQQKVIQDWETEVMDYYNEMMSTQSELSKSLAEVSEYFAEATETAIAAGLSEEDLAKLRQAETDITQKMIADASQEYANYVNSMLGNTSAMENQIADVNEKFDEYIKTAEELGASTETLTGIQQDQSEIIDKIVSESAKELVQSFFDIDLALLSWAQRMQGVSEQVVAFNELMAWRQQHGFSGDGEEDILDFQGMDATTIDLYVAELSKYTQAVSNALEATYEALSKVKDSIAKSREEIALEGMTSEQQAQHYLQKAYMGYAELSSTNVEDIPAATQEIHDNLMRYYDLEKQAITDRHQTEIEKIKEKHQVEIQNIEAVRQKLFDLTYSKFNLQLPKQRVEQATEDYATLLAAAQTGDAAAMSKYLAFVDTYLASAQEAYSSSEAYQQIYAQVIKDMEGLDTHKGQTIEEITAEQNSLIDAQTKAMESELAVLNATTLEGLNALEYTVDNTMTQVYTTLLQIHETLLYLISLGYSADAGGGMGGGYRAGGYADPEIKDLLRDIVAAQSSKQRVEIRLDSGRTLTGEMRAIADDLDQARAEKRIKNRTYR